MGDLLSHVKHAPPLGRFRGLGDTACRCLRGNACRALTPCVAPFWNSWNASTTRSQPKDRSDLFVCDTRSRHQIHVADKTRPPSRMPTSSRAVANTKVRIRKVRPRRVLEAERNARGTLRPKLRFFCFGAPPEFFVCSEFEISTKPRVRTRPFRLRRLSSDSLYRHVHRSPRHRGRRAFPPLRFVCPRRSALGENSNAAVTAVSCGDRQRGRPIARRRGAPP